ncbi:MAG: MATE family efflux transporter [Bacteroidaceae bacterium]|nr:MATE family efflux transporter [Bacteroidaceae bacterium]
MSMKKDDLLMLIRTGKPMTTRQQLHLTALLSMPAIMAQISSIIMQYIDASMVGSLGAEPAASIGLVSTSTWLFGGLPSAAAVGFYVQVAHRIGADDMEGAKHVLRQSLLACLLWVLMVTAIGVSISGGLPVWLGGNPDITADASTYFLIFSLALPAFQMNSLAGGMLRCSGNILIPSLLNVLLCVLDVVFNFFLIFPTREVSLLGLSMTVPGAGLGVKGAALGTCIAVYIIGLLMMYFMWFRSKELKLIGTHGSYMPTLETLKRAVTIGLPMGIEHVVMCGAQIMTTIIVAPLGTFAIAANSFAITAESLCYMPGYGIGDAATTLVGQSVGAGRVNLTKRFAKITVWMGIIVMTFMGIIMYVAAPLMMGLMTPVEEVKELGVMALRIEAFAEPMFAASIVAYGVFVGAGSTLVPCLMNFASMWAVRLSLAALLAPSLGLKGVWIAMCIELCFRGIIFLIRLKWGKWIKQNNS